MSWTNISNEEGGTSIRTKINNAMNALFGELPITQFWQEVSGQDRIEPTDSKGVQAPAAVFGGTFPDQISIGHDGTVRLSNLAGGVTHQRIKIDAEGFLITDPIEYLMYLTTEAEITWNGTISYFFINNTINMQINLPDPGLHLGSDFFVRKTSSNSAKVKIATTGPEFVRYDNAIGGNIETTTAGAFLHMKAMELSESVQYWVVINEKGTWTVT